MNVGRNIKLHGGFRLPFCFHKYWFTFFFYKNGYGFGTQSCDFKMEVALEFSLQLGNHEPQRSDFDIVCNAYKCT